MDKDKNPAEQPQPAPKANPEPVRSPSGDRPLSGEAYTDLPVFSKPSKRWQPLAASAVVILGLTLGAIYWQASRSPIPLDPSAAAAQEKVFRYGAADFDAEATDMARKLLARDNETHELAALARKPDAPAALKADQVAAALAQASPELKRAVVQGGAGFYTFQFRELADGGGDVYDISVDGVRVCRVTTSPQLASLTIPLDPKSPHTITETLVYRRDRSVYVNLAPGEKPADKPSENRTHMSVQSSAGEMRTRLAGPGDSDSWTVHFTGR